MLEKMGDVALAAEESWRRREEAGQLWERWMPVVGFGREREGLLKQAAMAIALVYSSAALQLLPLPSLSRWVQNSELLLFQKNFSRGPMGRSWLVGRRGWQQCSTLT